MIWAVGACDVLVASYRALALSFRCVIAVRVAGKREGAS
jgi:hypothetical protein